MTPDQITDATTFLFGVDRGDLLGRTRTARCVEARQALAWALRQNHWSLESIGDYLGKDHTTIIHGLRAIERKARHSPRLTEKLEALRRPIQPPLDWAARIEQLERRVADLEARL
jgi:chromosomal replication initiator protein